MPLKIVFLLSICIAQSAAIIHPFGSSWGRVRFRYSDGAQVEFKSVKFESSLKKDSPRIAHTRHRWLANNLRLSQSVRNLFPKPKPLTSPLANSYDRLVISCNNATIAVVADQQFRRCFDPQTSDFYYVRSIYEPQRKLNFEYRQRRKRHVYKLNKIGYFHRQKRQFFPGSPRLGKSDFPIEISALDSNVSITQMINVTSGRSLIDIKETFVQLRIDSNFSHARINTKQSRVNISLLLPTISVNTSQSLKLNMWSDESEMFVSTNKTDQSAFARIDSGKSGLSVDSVQSGVEAYTEVLSNVTVTQWSATGLEETITVSSERESSSNARNLNIVAVNEKAKITARLLKALSFITFADINIEIRTEDNELIIYTGTYIVTIKTILSAYSISMTKDLITFASDNITLLINPHTANITAFVPQSFMQILPENSTLELRSDSATGKDYADAHVSIESLKSMWEILPREEKIIGKITGTRAVVNANNTDVGIKADISNMEISSGRPVVIIEAGNTSIDIRRGDGGNFERDAKNLTFRPSTLPPFSSGTNWPSPTKTSTTEESQTGDKTDKNGKTTVSGSKQTYVTHAPIPITQCCANDTETATTTSVGTTETSTSQRGFITHQPIPIAQCCANESTKVSPTPPTTTSTATERSTTSSSLTAPTGAVVTPDFGASVSSSQLIQSASPTPNGSFAVDNTASTRSFTDFVVQQFSVKSTTRQPVATQVGGDCVNYTDSRIPRPANVCENGTSEATKSVSTRNSNETQSISTTSVTDKSTSSTTSTSTTSQTSTSTSTSTSTTTTAPTTTTTGTTTTPTTTTTGVLNESTTSTVTTTTPTTTSVLNESTTSTTGVAETTTSTTTTLSLSETSTATNATGSFLNDTIISLSTSTTSLANFSGTTAENFSSSSTENFSELTNAAETATSTTTTQLAETSMTTTNATDMANVSTSTTTTFTTANTSTLDNLTTAQNGSETTTYSSLNATDITANLTGISTTSTSILETSSTTTFGNTTDMGNLTTSSQTIFSNTTDNITASFNVSNDTTTPSSATANFTDFAAITTSSLVSGSNNISTTTAITNETSTTPANFTQISTWVTAIPTGMNLLNETTSSPSLNATELTTSFFGVANVSTTSVAITNATELLSTTSSIFNGSSLSTANISDNLTTPISSETTSTPNITSVLPTTTNTESTSTTTISEVSPTTTGSETSSTSSTTTTEPTTTINVTETTSTSSTTNSEPTTVTIANVTESTTTSLNESTSTGVPISSESTSTTTTTSLDTSTSSTSTTTSTSTADSTMTTTTVDLQLVDLSSNIAAIQVPPMNMSNWTSTTTELSTTTSVAQDFQPIGQSTERLTLRSRVPSDNFLMSVRLRVDPTTATNSQEFLTRVKSGLKRGYVEGRRKQLGTLARNDMVKYSTNEDIRPRRNYQTSTEAQLRRKRAPDEDLNANGTFNGDVAIEITSVDRISQEDVKVRFFVLSHERYVEGSKAKETFSEISNNELSAIMSLPVTEPVTTLMEEKSVETKTSGFTIPLYAIIILVVLGVLLILFIIIGVVCYKKQRNYFAKVKESSSEFSERNSPAPIITPDKSRVSSVASRYPIVKAYEGDDHTDRSRPKSESRSFPPVDRKKKLISEMSEAELIDDDAYEELFSYVKPPPPPKKSGLTRVHLRDEENLSPGANVPIYFPPTGGFEGSQIVRISPTQRRRQAREILDAAFPSPTAEVRRIFHSYADVI